MMVRDQQHSYGIAARNIVLMNAFEDIARSFEQAGIPVIVLKGMALLYNEMRSPAERPMADIDLLVQPQSLDSAEIVLAELGYQLKPETEKDGPFRSRSTGVLGFTGFWGSFSLVVELHWHICNVEWFRRLMSLDEMALWAEAQPLRVGEAQILQLAPADMLMHTCMHLMLHNFAHRVGYKDIASQLKDSGSFPWKRLLARAQQFQLRTAIYFPLEVAGKELGVQVPQEILAALRPARWRRWLMRRVADPRQGLSGSMVYTISRSYLVHLLVAERSRDVFDLLIWLLFPGRSWIRERYQTNGLAETLAQAFLHPLRVVREGVRSIEHVIGNKRV